MSESKLPREVKLDLPTEITVSAVDLFYLLDAINEAMVHKNPNKLVKLAENTEFNAARNLMTQYNDQVVKYRQAKTPQVSDTIGDN